MPSNCVYYVFTQFGEKKQKEGLERLSQIHKEIFPGKEHRTVVLDNKLEGKNVFIQCSEKVVKLSGDNSNREFSAYDKGLQFLKQQYAAKMDSPVIIANDTFFSNYGDNYLKLFTREKAADCLRQQGVLGHIDRFPQEVTLANLSFQKWIRTSYFFSTFDILNRIGPFSIPWETSTLFTGAVKNFFAVEAPLSVNYQNYLRFWLFDYENLVSEFPFEWHSKKPLTSENLKDFQDKTRSILAEHYFSARAQKLGVPLIALNF